MPNKLCRDKVEAQVCCDSCDKRIVGIRYKCAICADYDLCETCTGTVHQHHAFARIFSPTEKMSFDTNPSTAPPAPEFKVGEPEAAPKVRYFSRFVKDVSILDGTKVPAGSKFVKTWRMRNNGNLAWPEGTSFVNIGGDFMGRVERVPVRSAEPEEEVDISVEIEAPKVAGRYVSNWRLSTPTGMNFGHKVWVDVIVEELAEKEQEVAPPTKSEKEKEAPAETKIAEPVPEVKEKKVDDDVPNGPFRQSLIELYDMGFTDRGLNRQLLVKCKGDVLATVHELLKL